MRFFSLWDLQLVVLAILSGLVTSILIYIAWGSYPSRRAELKEDKLKSLEGHEMEGGHRIEDNPMSPFLIIVYLGAVAFSLVYAVVVGVYGGAIG